MRISRRHFFFGTLAVPVFADKKPAARPNVVVILVDNLPAWTLGIYGNKEIQTPNIDRLAQTGTRFLRHFACTAAPAEGRDTLLTGKTPMQPAGAATIDKILGGLGYAGGSVDEAVPGTPFCAIVHFTSLKPPYDGVAQKYRDMYAGSRFDSLNLDRAAAPNAREGRDMLADPVAGMRKAAAAITALDDEIGALVTKLAERKLRDGTIVIFTATCGALLGRHGLWDAGAASEPVNLYDETVATPMFWSWLGRVPAQATRPELVTALDVVPTLCEITGAPLPAGNLYGRSYLPLLTGQPLPKKQPWRTTVCARYQGADMAREERYKLVLRDGGKGPNELFDISQDPRERVNQYDNGSYTTVKDRLAAEVARWKQRYSS